jgi:hypothetical protein
MPSHGWDDLKKSFIWPKIQQIKLTPAVLAGILYLDSSISTSFEKPKRFVEAWT